MEQKKLILIGVLCVVICIFAGAIFGILTNNVTYERIEIVPNGTTIEMPEKNNTFQGEINNTAFKIWTFKQGSVTSYNSEEGGSRGLVYALGGAYGFKESMDLIKNHFEKQEKIDDYLVYTIDTDKLNPEGGSGIMYCIILQNDTSHDNIIIVASTKEIALHIAKSIQYKSPNLIPAGSASVSPNSVSTNNNSTDLNKAWDNYNKKMSEYEKEYNNNFPSGGQSSQPSTDDKGSSDTPTPSPSPTPSPDDGGQPII